MKRRKALQQIGWGLSGGIILPPLLSACASKDPSPQIAYSGTVAVIGAGASGLYVADILHSKGINVKIFEARDQIGGRIRSLRNQRDKANLAIQPVPEYYPDIPLLSSDFPLELGAQTIIGSDSIFGKIFQAYGLPTSEFLPATTHFVLGNTANNATGWGSDPDFLAASNFRANLKNNVGSSQTVLQAASGIGSRAQGMLNGEIGNFYGGDNNVAGIGELAEEETLRKTDGKIIALKANPMQDAIISRFSAVQDFVQLNTPITSVNYSGEVITLTAKDGSTYEANKVVVTVPVSMLKSGGITFSPGLPGSFTSSLARIGMGASLRVVLEFKKNFWGDSVGFIYGSSNVPEYFSMGLGRSQFNATLSVTVNGARGDAYSAMGDGAVNAILADIDLLYPDKILSFPGLGTQFIRKDIATNKNIYILHDWTKTEYIKGGYSYPLAGANNADRNAIGLPVNGKLFFAGEATDVSGQAGMVNGALASAERAAQNVIDSILNP